MGRGRAKAKQTKVARDLKYHSPATDYRSLERELSGRPEDDSRAAVDRDVDDDELDPYAQDPYADDDDDESEADDDSRYFG